MSLRVWLPLTSNIIRNNGLENLDFSSSVAMQLEDNGKIGKCLYRNNAGVIRSNLFNINSITEASICLWLKMPADYTVNGYIAGLSAGTSPNFMFYNYGAKIIRIYVNGSNRLSYTYDFVAEEWYHIAATYNGNLLTLYINGKQVKTATGSWDISEQERIMIGGRSNNASGGLAVARNNYYNDFRYYDHCLSPLEVKEIAQGLVLHYKLDDISNGIQDSSGYNHNLTLTGNLLNDNTTPRYSTSMAFNGTTVATAASTGADIRTISCWVKTTKNKSTSQIFVADSGSNMCVSFYNGAIIGVFGTTKSTGSKCTLDSSYKENDWNHIVVIKTSDNGMRDIWCNGEKLTPTSNDYWSPAAGIWLGARNASLSNPLYGSLSDVRFYCTPLLDIDIKSLYNIGMKVDNLQNIHTFELNENKNKIAITRTGQLYCNELNETTAAKFHKNLIIETAEIIER